MNESFFEVTIEGNLELMKGFVAGFLEGRGVAGDVFFGDDYHIDGESPTGLLLRLTGVRGKTCTVIVGAGLHNLLATALEKRQRVVPLKILKVRQIVDAAFEIAFRTYSREVGAEIKALLDGLPEGVGRNADFKLHEVLDPEGKGVDAYAPLHEYELDGKGRISGPVKGVFGLYHLLGRFEVAELGDLELTYGDSF
ncbi:MAG: hypothetical protein M0P16_12635 [Syntrophales bacterium]|jgi:hypothetical protein|nr:hypothetical protein [Syntrophales bacterium]MCK9392650.1 hypothetical protein [Syntrophales bacterium]